MESINPNIYISHAWGGESEKVVNDIVKIFRKQKLQITLDRDDLGYRQSITSFMQKLGKADAIIMVISNKYLHSEYCMFELLQIYDNKNMLERIFPIVLDEVKISKSTDRIELVKYWENQCDELELKIRDLKSLNNIEGIREDLDLYHNIRTNIAKLTSILKDINTLNINKHKDSNYQYLIDAIKNKLTNTQTDDSGIIAQNLNLGYRNINYTDPLTEKVNSTYYKNILIIIVIIFVVILSGIYISRYLNNPSIDPSSLSMESKHEMKKNGELTTSSDEIKDKENTSSLSNENKFYGKNIIKNGQESITNKDHTPEIKTSKSSNLPIAKNEVENIKHDESKPSANPNSPLENRKLINVESQLIEVEFTNDISPNDVNEGQLIYLKNNSQIKKGSDLIISKGAIVRAKVKSATPSINGSIGVLSIELVDVQTATKEWKSINYPEYSIKKRDNIVFKKGQKISRVKLNSFSIFL